MGMSPPQKAQPAVGGIQVSLDLVALEGAGLWKGPTHLLMGGLWSSLIGGSCKIDWHRQLTWGLPTTTNSTFGYKAANNRDH